MAKPRKLTTQPRMPSGRLAMADRGETEEQVLSIALWQRRKMGATADNFRSQEWESPLGQLRMRAKTANSDGEGLSDTQYRAIREYVTIRHRWRVSQGFGGENPKSIAAELVGGSSGATGWIDDDETALRKTAAYNGARSALLEYPQQGVVWVKVLERLARDEPIAEREIGDARMAANVLARHFKI